MFHVEADSYLIISDAIDIIKDNGIKAGLALKPRTPASVLYPFIDRLDMALVMTVEPGFVGQSFLWEMLKKVQFLRQKAAEQGLSVSIQVDGGVNAETAPEAVKAGANNLVVGSYLFRQENLKTAVDFFHQLAD